MAKAGPWGPLGLGRWFTRSLGTGEMLLPSRGGPGSFTHAALQPGVLGLSVGPPLVHTVTEVIKADDGSGEGGTSDLGRLEVDSLCHPLPAPTDHGASVFPSVQWNP